MDLLHWFLANKSFFSLIVGICLVVYCLSVYRHSPDRLTTEFTQVTEWKKRQLKSMLIWLPFFLVSLILFEKFFSNNNLMLVVLGGASIVAAFIVEKLFFPHGKDNT